MRRVTVDQARRIAVAAQGFNDPPLRGPADVRAFRRVFRRIGLLQLDSVNVLARSHYLPVLARLGPYDRDRLDAYTSASGEVVECWAHVASLVPVEDFPLYRHAMEAKSMWPELAAVEQERPGYVEAVYREIAEHGPLTASELSDPGERTGPWWGYGHGKLALEWLFRRGRIISWRGPGFTKIYDITERVIPAHLLGAEFPSRDEAYRTHLLQAARHHGIGTAKDLVDYHRISLVRSRPILDELVAASELDEVEVPGWKGPVYLHPEARMPRRPTGTALLSPFDPLVWERSRNERIFDFRYRIEIYTPEPKRVYGYYVLPFLLDGELTGRVDLKADRQGGRLLVQSAWLEDGQDPNRVARGMVAPLHEMASWLGLTEVEVRRRGNLAEHLRTALG